MRTDTDGEVRCDTVPAGDGLGGGEAEMRALTLGMEEDEAAEMYEGADGPENNDPLSPDATGKKRSMVKGIGKGIKSLWRSASFRTGGDDKPAKERILNELARCRHPRAHKDGGLINDDLEGIKMSRSVVAEIVKLMGKKLLSGQNLMSVTFPVRCCQPRTILECAAYQFVYAPHYLGRAAEAKDPAERLKQVVCCFTACMHTTSQFVKPFNPTLGETYQAEFAGGVALHMEQTSHHPPVTSWLLTGPGGAWRYFGWSTYEASFGYNRLFVKQSGLRQCEFADGTVIDVGFSMDRYNNVYWGELVQEMVGAYVFTDKKAGVRCTVELNAVKGAPSDVVAGSIERFGKDGAAQGGPVCAVEGSWLGYLDFDGVQVLGLLVRDAGGAGAGGGPAAVGLAVPR